MVKEELCDKPKRVISTAFMSETKANDVVVRDVDLISDFGGEEGVLLDNGENDRFIKALSPNSVCMNIQKFFFRARREALECIMIGLDLCIQEVDGSAINALAKHRHIWSDFGFSDCQKVGEMSLGDVALRWTSRFSANQQSCVFDPGGTTSQNFASDWKKIEAFIGSPVTDVIPIIGSKVVRGTDEEESESIDDNLVFSFKLQGASNMTEKLSREKLEREMLCSSADKQAHGVALSVQQVKCNSVIVMSMTSPNMKQGSIGGLGATIVIVRHLNNKAQALAKEQTVEKGRTFTPPFDNCELLADASENGVFPEVKISGIKPFLCQCIGIIVEC